MGTSRLSDCTHDLSPMLTARGFGPLIMGVLQFSFSSCAKSIILIAHISVIYGDEAMSMMPRASFAAAFSLMRENITVVIGTPMMPVMTVIKRNA